MSNVEDAIEFLREANDAESENRQLGLKALKFRWGEQWPAYAIASRGLDRPQLTINETDTYIRKVCNAQRKQRPRGRASPVDDKADVKTAKVVTGLIRHIEVNSDADNAYDTAYEFASEIGWGYWRLRHDYISETSFDQDIYVDTIANPFSVYFDYNSTLPDGSDAEKCLITDLMPKESFKKEHPGAQVISFEERGTGDSDPDWATQHDIRVAEYYYVEREKALLVALSNGMAVWSDELPSGALMLAAGIRIIGDRHSYRRKVKWQKQTCYDVLEETDVPGRYIPVLPLYWSSKVIESKTIKQGLVQNAMDPQRMLNFWNTAVTEYLALAPKAKWLMAEGQDEGHEKEFANANINPTPVLRYKQTDVENREAPPPQRVAPEPPPSGLIEATFMANQNLSRVMGVYDPAVRGGAQHKSDMTLNAEEEQGNLTNFHGYDNMTRSMKHSYRIMLSWFPSIYKTPNRIQRIIGEDGRDSLVTLNEQSPEETVLNNVTVGQYDVVMQVGPGYDTRRQEGAATSIELLKTPLGEVIAQTSSDLIIRQMDFPGAEAIADRMAAANPLAQIDEDSEIPPELQMRMKGMQMMIEKQQGQMQEMGMQLKYRSDVAAMKDQGDTKRKLMDVTAKAHDTEQRNLSMQHSVETKSQTDQNIAELNAIVKAVIAQVDTRHLQMEIDQRDREQQAKHAEIASQQPA